MNPTTASMPAPRTVNNVAAPQSSPPTAPAVQAPPDTSPVAAGPNIVSNIPVHAPQAPAPISEDTELDKIMHDVGREMKKEDKKPPKHGLLSFLHHEPKPLVKVNNQAASPAPAVPQPTPLPIPAAATAAPAAAVQPAVTPVAAVQAKPAADRHIPFFVIFVALCITGFLIAAAIAAYR